MKSLKEVTCQIVSVVWQLLSTIFSPLLFLYQLIIKIVKNHGRSGKLWTIKRFLSTYNVCDLVSSTVTYISCVFIGYKYVFGPIAVLVTNRFRLEQKSYLPLKSGFGKTTIFKIKRFLSTYNVCDLVSSTVRKFIHSICCKMYMYEFHFTEIGNLFVSILR
jgi:hypothetical protein